MKAVFSKATLLAAVALLALTTPLSAHSMQKEMSMVGPRDGHGQMMGMGQMDRMDDMSGTCLEHAEKLGLTDAQLMKIKPIHNEMQKKQARFKADVKIAEIELMEIMDVKDFDLEKASSAVNKVAEIKTAHHQDMLKTMKSVRTILTNEQYKNMQAMKPMMAKKSPVKRMKKK